MRRVITFYQIFKEKFCFASSTVTRSSEQHESIVSALINTGLKTDLIGLVRYKEKEWEDIKRLGGGGDINGFGGFKGMRRNEGDIKRLGVGEYKGIGGY